MPAPAVSITDLVPAISSYAARLHAAADKEHHVASPLGAWMLLALCATGADGRLHDELTRILGVDVETAAGFAASLLDMPHPGVALASGVWTSPDVRAESAARWLASLPVGVDRGPLPTQPALDTWAHARTRGLIPRFPRQRSPDDALILATALATDVTWQKPFVSVAASQRGLTGTTMWSGALERVMKAPEADSHRAFIAATQRAGDVAVHVADAEQAMSVTSVIAAPDVPRADVMAAAYEIACGRHVESRSLFDLPIGSTSIWRITEQAIPTSAADGRMERYEAVLPAWRAAGSIDLGRGDLGFATAAAALKQVLGMADYQYEATQAVVARYGLKGFVAAALSSFAEGFTAMPVRNRGLLRTATLQFGHPYAVVAVTSDLRRPDRTKYVGPWDRVPVYSAWVAEPSEPDGK